MQHRSKYMCSIYTVMNETWVHTVHGDTIGRFTKTVQFGIKIPTMFKETNNYDSTIASVLSWHMYALLHKSVSVKCVHNLNITCTQITGTIQRKMLSFNYLLNNFDYLHLGFIDYIYNMSMPLPPYTQSTCT